MMKVLEATVCVESANLSWQHPAIYKRKLFSIIITLTNSHNVYSKHKQ